MFDPSISTKDLWTEKFIPYYGEWKTRWGSAPHKKRKLYQALKLLFHIYKM